MAEKVTWSFTDLNTLRECNRKYYFSKVASRSFTDVMRRKVYELKNMQTLTMWTGSVVDKFMETVIIPYIVDKRTLNFEQLADDAVALAKRQFEYSKLAVYTDPQTTKKDAGPDYCILDIHELGKPYLEEDISSAYSLIREAVCRIPSIQMPDGQLLIEFLKNCNRLTANLNTWKIDIELASVKPQIDLLALYNWKPVVMDWKVSQSLVSDYSRQLTIIGLVVYLKRLDNQNQTPYQFEDIRLFEVNLLKGTVRQHLFTQERFNRMIDEIFLTSQDMKLLSKETQPNIEDFELTDNPISCKLCNYRSICSYLEDNNNQFYETTYSQFVQDRQFA